MIGDLPAGGGFVFDGPGFGQFAVRADFVGRDPVLGAAGGEHFACFGMDGESVIETVAVGVGTTMFVVDVIKDFAVGDFNGGEVLLEADGGDDGHVFAGDFDDVDGVLADYRMGADGRNEFARGKHLGG